MTTVKVDSTVVVSPKRSWLFPPSLLLPDIPIRATIKLGVKGSLDTGKVSGMPLHRAMLRYAVHLPLLYECVGMGYNTTQR